MKLFLKNFRFSTFGMALLCFALGLALLVWPGLSMQICCYAFGGVLVVGGLLQIGAYLFRTERSLLQKLMLCAGVVMIVVGIAVILNPGHVMTLAVIVMGIVLLYHGVMDIKYALDIARTGLRGWAAAVLLFGIATCALGVLILVDPFEKEGLLIVMAGISFLFDGLTDAVTVVQIARGERRLALGAAAPAAEIPAENVQVTDAEAR